MNLDYFERNKDYSEMQEIASCISGYDHRTNMSSAKDDNYYKCKTKSEKIWHINIMCENFENISFLSDELEKVYNFLEKDHEGTNEWYHDFEDLAQT